MIKSRKSISLLLASLIVMVLLFTSCNSGGKDTGADATPTPEPTAEPVPTGDTNEPEETGVELGLPIVEEKVTLNFMRFKHPLNIPLNDMPMFKRLEEATNVHIEWEDVAHTAWLERLGLALASGDIPDAIFGGAVSDYDVLSNKHLFLPLEDLVSQYAPNVAMMFEKRPEAKRQSTADDGKIYSLPLLYEVFASDTTPVFGINKVWLDNLGLDMPTTTEEFYSVLKAFKEGDPNQNGENDEIPFAFASLDNDWAGAGSFFGSFGVLPSLSLVPSTKMQIINNELVYPHTHPGFKEGIAYFHRLYSEGLIDPEVFTQDGTQYMAKVAMDPPIVGVLGGWLLSANVSQNRVDEYVQLLPLKGPNGDQLYHKNTPSTVIRHYFLLSAKTEYPEVAVRWINECYGEDMSIQMVFGNYGEQIEKLPDGSIKFLDPPEGMAHGPWTWTNALVSNSPAAIYAEWQDRFEATPQQLEKIEVNKLYAPYLPEKVFPNIFYSKEQLDEMNPLINDINAYELEKVTGWVMNGGVEEEWDAYVKQLNAMGLPRLIEIYTEAYDNYYK